MNNRLKELVRQLDLAGGAKFSWDEPDFPSSGTHQVNGAQADEFLDKPGYKVETITIIDGDTKTVIKVKRGGKK